ncbi:MAG: OmpH family outer membrane protein [Bacteroidales bacterium]
MEENIKQKEMITNDTSSKKDIQPYLESDKKDRRKQSKISYLLFATLMIACIALIVGMVSLLKKDNNITETKVKAEKIIQSGNMKIAYINTDTIMAKYAMAIEMQKELKSKQLSLETTLKNQYTQLQKEEQEYLKTGQNLTLTQQQTKEKEFQQREQKLSVAMQQQPAQFQQEVAKQNEKLLNAVLAFVKDYNAKHDKYNVILSNSRYNGPTLYIDEGMDITEEIVKGLNEEYSNIKNSK